MGDTIMQNHITLHNPHPINSILPRPLINSNSQGVAILSLQNKSIVQIRRVPDVVEAEIRRRRRRYYVPLQNCRQIRGAVGVEQP